VENVDNYPWISQFSGSVRPDMKTIIFTIPAMCFLWVLAVFQFENTNIRLDYYNPGLFHGTTKDFLHHLKERDPRTHRLFSGPFRMDLSFTELASTELNTTQGISPGLLLLLCRFAVLDSKVASGLIAEQSNLIAFVQPHMTSVWSTIWFPLVFLFYWTPWTPMISMIALPNSASIQLDHVCIAIPTCFYADT
jgi:hypothetical protein